jgi:hypothetical protein
MMFGNILFFLIIGAVVYMMMKNSGGCCGGHDHGNKDTPENPGGRKDPGQCH